MQADATMISLKEAEDDDFVHPHQEICEDGSSLVLNSSAKSFKVISHSRPCDRLSVDLPSLTYRTVTVGLHLSPPVFRQLWYL